MISFMLYKKPRNDWSMARVIEVHRSHDGVVRSVMLLLGVRGYPKVKARQLVRPLSKLVVLVKAPSKISS